MIHSTKPEPKQIWANFMDSLNNTEWGRQWIFHQVGVMIRVMCQDAFMVASLSFSWFSVFCSCLFSSPSVTRLDSSVDAISDGSSSSVWRGWSLMFGIVWHRLWLINANYMNQEHLKVESASSWHLVKNSLRLAHIFSRPIIAAKFQSFSSFYSVYLGIIRNLNTFFGQIWALEW